MHILLVEDDVKFAKNLRTALEIEGYKVDVASDGMRGLARGLRPTYDLIIMDRMLPKKDGVSVVAELRNQNIQIPIIILTARGELEDRVSGLDSGADDYLVKPFGFEELFARLRSLLRRKKTTEQPLLRAQDLEVDPASREVRRAGSLVQLSPKEYRLLLYLLRNRHKVITRGELTRLLWKVRPTGNQLDVHIRYLRRKIDDGQAKKIIYTVKGVGYKIKI
jgi:DNA-binding response OmpR family regulator